MTVKILFGHFETGGGGGSWEKENGSEGRRWLRAEMKVLCPGACLGWCGRGSSEVVIIKRMGKVFPGGATGPLPG